MATPGNISGGAFTYIWNPESNLLHTRLLNQEPVSRDGEGGIRHMGGAFRPVLRETL